MYNILCNLFAIFSTGIQVLFKDYFFPIKAITNFSQQLFNSKQAVSKEFVG